MTGGSAVGRDLVSWYRSHARDLPWRRKPEPYRVWISEVMLQQTTVATAVPYFERFTERFPTLDALASAREEEVLALWSGLGYYHRARNLLASARRVRDRHAGRIPCDPEALRSLPGVGPYTAGAILSIGHNLPFAAIDGNVTRVAARLAALEADPSRAAGRREIERLVLAWMPEGEACAFNQALMDLGATICLPASPRCGACPVKRRCKAKRDGMVDRIPPQARGRGSVKVDLSALAIRRGGDCLLVQRPSGTLMRRMWEFPLVAAPTDGMLDEAARRLGARLDLRLGSISHTITRHRIKIEVWSAAPVRGRLASLRSGAVTLSEPTAPVATPAGLLPVRWERIDRLASGGAAVALTGTARKIARLVAGGAA